VARDELDVRAVTPVPGVTTSEAVAEMLAVVPFDEGDPRAVLSAIAVRLAAAFDERHSPGLARELRYAVQAISDEPSRPATVVDDLRARRMARRVDGVIRHHLEAGAGDL
jgi:hypothetical protein